MIKGQEGDREKKKKSWEKLKIQATISNLDVYSIFITVAKLLSYFSTHIFLIGDLRKWRPSKKIKLRNFECKNWRKKNHFWMLDKISEMWMKKKELIKKIIFSVVLLILKNASTTYLLLLLEKCKIKGGKCVQFQCPWSYFCSMMKSCFLKLNTFGLFYHTVTIEWHFLNMNKF